ncbi:POTE ankyrin domain family member A-like isoform X2 [Carlito syrichta]|nr:POTE ankyrin domain family member A-like isoform X2 [Carlito syrichta]
MQKSKWWSFLVNKGANVNAVDICQRTTLMFAVCCKSPSMVSILLQKNTDVFRRDPIGKTAEDDAARWKYHALSSKLSSEHSQSTPDDDGTKLLLNWKIALMVFFSRSY